MNIYCFLASLVEIYVINSILINLIMWLDEMFVGHLDLFEVCASLF